MSAAPAYVLFDIDGTLLRRSGPHHRQALVDAVRSIMRIESTTEGIPVQGMLDRDILTAMLREANIPDKQIQSAMPALIRRAQWLYPRNCAPHLRDKLCPGVDEFLTVLRKHRIPTALVSGNLSRIGWKKLELAGIKHHFQFGSFAERADTRSGLAKLAIAEGRSRGWVDKRTRISLIGDHTNDVNAARANRIQAIAVATGLCPRDELASANPDILLDDLRNLTLEQVL